MPSEIHSHRVEVTDDLDVDAVPPSTPPTRASPLSISMDTVLPKDVAALPDLVAVEPPHQ